MTIYALLFSPLPQKSTERTADAVYLDLHAFHINFVVPRLQAPRSPLPRRNGSKSPIRTSPTIDNKGNAICSHTSTITVVDMWCTHLSEAKKMKFVCKLSSPARLVVHDTPNWKLEWVISIFRSHSAASSLLAVPSPMFPIQGACQRPA